MRRPRQSPRRPRRSRGPAAAAAAASNDGNGRQRDGVGSGLPRNRRGDAGGRRQSRRRRRSVVVCGSVRRCSRSRSRVRLHHAPQRAQDGLWPGSGAQQRQMRSSSSGGHQEGSGGLLFRVAESYFFFKASFLSFLFRPKDSSHRPPPPLPLSLIFFFLSLPLLLTSRESRQWRAPRPPEAAS